MVVSVFLFFCFFFSSRRRHTRWSGDWSSDVCSSDLKGKSLNFSKSLYITLTQDTLLCWGANATCEYVCMKDLVKHCRNHNSPSNASATTSLAFRSLECVMVPGDGWESLQNERSRITLKRLAPCSAIYSDVTVPSNIFFTPHQPIVQSFGSWLLRTNQEISLGIVPPNPV